ncbi:Serine/threonine-protein kinase tor [Trichinella spiralis]|uniref:Serine/threonine-protein kinase tor n=1 Tax=Trichinella spiralis TaxID=6334 RepID=A0ABR3K8U0_TRISP
MLQWICRSKKSKIHFNWFNNYFEQISQSKTILQYTNCTHCPVKKRVSKASWPTRRSVFAAAASPRISFANDD